MVGVGAGDPEHVTVQAIKALNRAEVVFVVEKRAETDELVRLRHEILERYVEGSPRTVALPDPPRDRSSPAYREAVEEWRAKRAERWEQAIAGELGDDGCGAFLVWGDPAIYDSTLAVIDRILARVLAAHQRIAFNRVGGAVQITTGRRLAAGWPEGADDVIVMLDSDCTFTRFAGEEIDIYWGAYLGTEDEILISGRVGEVAEEIRRLRSEARGRKGWVMDTYLLRRPPRS